MNYTEMLFNRDERLVNLLNQADSKNLELIGEINKKEEEIERLQNKLEVERKTTQKFIDELSNITDIALKRENIIKEVREYVEEMQIWLVDFEDFGITTKGLLEILDKGE